MYITSITTKGGDKEGNLLFIYDSFHRFFHLGLVRIDNEPEPVHGDGDHREGGHEGSHTGNSASQSGMRTKCFFIRSVFFIILLMFDSKHQSVFYYSAVYFLRHIYFKISFTDDCINKKQPV